MTKVLLHAIGFFGILAILTGCAKQQEDLDLDGAYLHVADVLRYCQGSCDVQLEWEGKEILVTGHITDAGDPATMLQYFEEGRFYLHDIRNGMFMEVRISGDKEAIFAFLSGIGKADDIYIRGTSEPVIVNDGNNCQKGVVIILNSAQNIISNL